jgi:hypothetical protein
MGITLQVESTSLPLTRLEVCDHVQYIKPYLDLPHTHTNYPTLDHIKPRSQCFREGISPYDATKPENLAWTKRVNNSKKSQKKLK